MWIFGYGSLVWRPNFRFVEQAEGYIDGYVRRFWQGSADHRGTPSLPGRVVTLIPQANAQCWGIAYRIEGHEAERVLAQLDHREQAGYERATVSIHCRKHATVSATIYFADPENPSWLGPATADAIAVRAQHAVGMSGPNHEYVLRLAETLHAINAEDEHVFAVEAALKRRMSNDT